MKLKFWVHIVDCGDGSAYAEPYPTEAEAKAAAEEELQECGQALCENVHSITLSEDFLQRTEGYADIRQAIIKKICEPSSN